MNNANYITVHNLELTEHTVNGEHNVTVFTDAITYKSYIISLIDSYFYQIATVSDIDGISYILNMQNVNSISDNYYDTLRIDFNNQEIIYIRFNSIARMSYEKKYIQFIYEANHFESIYGSARRLRVSPEFTTDNDNLTYETIQEANDNSEIGDVIYIYAGEYSEKVITKNGRIYYFEDNANITSSLASVLDNERADTETLEFIKVFGRGKFISTSGAFDSVITMSNEVTAITEDNTLTIFVECKELYHSAGRVVLISETVLKCKHIHNDSSSYAVWDTDVACDYDIVNIVDSRLIQSYLNEFTFHQDLSYVNYVVKNAVILCDSASGLINVGEMGIEIKQTMELCMLFNLDQSGGGIVNNTGGYGIYLDLYNCVLQQEAGTYSNSSVVNTITNYNLYSHNYFTKTYNTSISVMTDYNTSTNYKLIA